MKFTKMSLAVAIVAMSTTGLSADSSSLEESILNNFEYSGGLRLRYEHADVKDNGADSADSMTMRFTLGAKANVGSIEGLSVFGQMMGITNFGYDEYAPEDASYDLIADPENNRITQAYIDYKANKTLLRVGRQMVNLDDQRFIGAVGWRQMPQTFTGYAVVDNTFENLNLMGAYVTQRHGIIDGLSSGTKTVLLHAAYDVMPALKLTGYGYLIGSSSDTYGIMATGKAANVAYIAEVATQQDASLEFNNAGEPEVDAMYYRLDLSTKYNGIIVGAAYESLGKADGKAHGFTTPLATLHKWQGFADVFLGYTAASNTYGLQDIYGKIGYADKSFGKLLAIYHQFSADESTAGTTDDAGSEIDALYVKKLTNQLGFLAKASFFSGEEDSVISAAHNDVTKYWMQLDYKF